ncbi:MAG: hypothetical protein ACHQHO_08315 [Solirubrobacterales bacterium]
MSTFLILNVTAITLFAWFGLIKIIPSCNLSIFRYRLWRLRDRLADEVLDGSFQDGTQPQALVRFIEGVIELAPEIGALKLLAMRWSCRHVQVPELFNVEALDPRDKVVVEQRLDELRAITIRHVLFGAPSGWVLTGVLVPVALLASVLEHLLRLLKGDRDGTSVIEEARHKVRDDVEVDPALVLLGSRGAASMRSLTYSV